MPRNLIFFLSGLVIFFLFVFFSYLVHEDLFTKFDFDTTVKLQDNIPKRFDGIFSTFSVLGNFEILLGFLVIMLIISKKYVAGFLTFCAFGLFHLIELFGKIFVAHPPPPELMLRTDKPFDLPQFHVRSEFSYPSGHSGRTVFISVILLFFIWNNKKIPTSLKIILSVALLAINIIMLVSRVYLGEHWLTDVIGGTLLALGLSLMSLSFFPFPNLSSFFTKGPQKKAHKA